MNNCPITEALKLAGTKPVKVWFIPVRDVNGIPVDKVLRIKEDGPMYIKLN